MKKRQLAKTTHEDPGWRTAVAKAIKEFKYGDLIEHDWLYTAFGVARDNTRDSQQAFMFEMMPFVKAMLVDHKMHLRNVYARGWEIVPVEEQSDAGQNVARHMILRGIDKGVEIIRNTNEDLLSEEGKRRKDEALGKLEALKMFNRNRLDPSKK